MSPKSLPFVALLALLFGTTLVVSRFSVGQFAPLTYVGLRLLLASLCHVVIFALSSKRTWPQDRQVWRHAPVLGILGTVIPMNFIIASLLYQSSGITSLLLTAAPAVTVVLAHFFLPDERLNGGKILGVVLAISGAATLVLLGENGLPDAQEANPLGYILVLVAIFSFSVANIYVRRNLRDANAFDVASVRMWTAVAVVLPLAYIFSGLDLSHVEASGYLALLYAGLIGSFCGMLLELNIIQRFGATATAMTANLIPIVALFGGWLFLDERISAGMIGAMVLILLGVSIITRSESAPLATAVES